MMRTPFMLDLFAGLGGASAAMRDRGWRVVTVDSEERFVPTICADVSRLDWPGTAAVDLLWASPPCDEFARESMPWCKTGNAPSLALVEATIRLRDRIRPRFWIVENVRGSVRYLSPLLGPPLVQLGPSQSYLWGNLPLLMPRGICTGKERMSSSAAAERAAIPYDVSLVVAMAVERAISVDAGRAA